MSKYSISKYIVIKRSSSIQHFIFLQLKNTWYWFVEWIFEIVEFYLDPWVLGKRHGVSVSTSTAHCGPLPYEVHYSPIRLGGTQILEITYSSNTVYVSCLIPLYFILKCTISSNKLEDSARILQTIRHCSLIENARPREIKQILGV